MPVSEELTSRAPGPAARHARPRLFRRRAAENPLDAAAPPAAPPPSRDPGSRTHRTAALGARALGYGLVTGAIGAGVAVGLEWAQAAAVFPGQGLDRLGALPAGVLALEALVLWTVTLLLLAVTGRLWAAIGLPLILAAVVGFANYQKFTLRGEPVYPSDIVYLAELEFLVDNVGTGPALLLAAGALGGLLLPWGISRLWRRVRRRRRAPARLLSRAQAWAARGLVAGLAAAVLVTAAGFNDSGNRLRAAFEEAGASWAPWNQPENYVENGFVGGTLYNLPAPAMDRPAGYGAGTMRAIAETYRQAAASTNTSRDPAALAGANIVVILGETFSDPLAVDGLTYGEDPMPFTRDLMTRTTSGSVLTPAFAGGTANVEFEVLTGMALKNFQPQMHVPFQMLIPHRESFPSFVPVLAGDEREAIAIHPFLSSFYQRDAVYPALGFTRATFADAMTHQGRNENEPYIADRAAYREVVDELRDSAEPLLVNLVTMQNHRPVTGRYAEPIRVEGPVTPAEADTLGQYLRAVRYSDLAIEQLVADLEALEERTIVLFYGDHLAAEWPTSVLDRNDPRVRYSTPYFVWANFETQRVQRQALGPTFLVNQLLAAANAPVTPYGALLDELSAEVAAFEPSVLLDGDGAVIEEEELSARAQELLEHYRLVQYDLVEGEGYVAEEMLSLPGGS